MRWQSAAKRVAAAGLLAMLSACVEQPDPVESTAVAQPLPSLSGEERAAIERQLARLAGATPDQGPDAATDEVILALIRQLQAKASAAQQQPHEPECDDDGCCDDDCDEG